MTERKDYPALQAALDAVTEAYRAGMRAAAARSASPLLEAALIAEAHAKAALPDKPVADLGTCGARVNQFVHLELDQRQAEDMQAHLQAARAKAGEFWTWLIASKDRARVMVGDETATVLEDMIGDFVDALDSRLEPAIADITEVIAKLAELAELPAADRAKLERAQKGEERE